MPIYHVHGFLPRGGAFDGLSEHRLVFTDSQYWSSGAAQASLANRTMNAALADSHCLFIGLSMTDANLLRWLGQRYNQIADDTHAAAERVRRAGSSSPLAGGFDGEALEARIESRVRRHFWIRTPTDDPTGLLTEFLRRRGVDAVEIPSWSDGSFAPCSGSASARSDRTTGARTGAAVPFSDRRGGRAVECGGLENRSARERRGGSNPLPSVLVEPKTAYPSGFSALPRASTDAVRSCDMLYDVLADLYRDWA